MSEADKGNIPSRAMELMAFLSDGETHDLVQSLVFDLEVQNAEVRMGGIDEVIGYMRTLPSWPRQLMVDITDSALPLSDMNRLADIAEPGTRIVVVGDRNDVGLFRDLIQLGVADYLVKPIAPAMLRRSLTFSPAVTEARQSREGKVIAVIGARGGVGATTVATNIAWQLAHVLSRRTLLVDLDVHNGPVNMMLDLKPNQGLAEALEKPETLDPAGVERFVTMKGPRLFTLTADLPLKTPSPVTPLSVASLSGALINHFHFVVYDCPWHSGEVMNLLAERADFVVTIADPGMVAVRNLSRIARLRDAVADAQPMTLVCNHIRPKSAESLTSGAMEAAFGRPIDYTLPHTPSLVRSQNLGRAQDAQPASYTNVILDIVREIGGGTATEQREESGSIFKRMFSG
jgi:pilus assembly protein CpaE